MSKFYDPMKLNPSNPPGYHTHSMGGVAAMADQYVGHVHILSITNQAEDYGQDNYKESYVWEIRHNQECEKRADSAYVVNHMRSGIIHPNNIIRDELEYDRVWIYTCPMAEEIQRLGLNNLEMNWLDMEVGDYEICLAHSKYDTYDQRWGTQYSPPSRICLL